MLSYSHGVKWASDVAEELLDYFGLGNVLLLDSMRFKMKLLEWDFKEIITILKKKMKKNKNIN